MTQGGVTILDARPLVIRQIAPSRLFPYRRRVAPLIGGVPGDRRVPRLVVRPPFVGRVSPGATGRERRGSFGRLPESERRSLRSKFARSEGVRRPRGLFLSYLRRNRLGDTFSGVRGSLAQLRGIAHPGVCLRRKVRREVLAALGFPRQKKGNKSFGLQSRIDCSVWRV